MMDDPCPDCRTTLPHEVIGCPPAMFVAQWHADQEAADR